MGESACWYGKGEKRVCLCAATLSGNGPALASPLQLHSAKSAKIRVTYPLRLPSLSPRVKPVFLLMIDYLSRGGEEEEKRRDWRVFILIYIFLC